MNRVLTVFWYELKRNLRRKGYLFATFGLPLIGYLLLFGFQFIQNTTGTDDVVEEVSQIEFESIETAGYVDLSGVIASPEGELAELILPYESVVDARSAMQNGEIDVFYVFEEDYLETGAVTEYLPQLDLAKVSTQPVRQLVYNSVGDDLAPSFLLRLRTPSILQEFNLGRATSDNGEVDERNEDADFVAVYVFSIVFIAGIVLTNGYLMQSIIEEKENHLIEIMLSTMRPFQLLLGKVLALSSMGLVQILVWAVALIGVVVVSGQLSVLQETVIPQIQIPFGMLLPMFIYFILGYLFFAAGFSMIGALAGSMRDGQQFIAILVIPSMLPYYFFALFAEAPNGGLPTFFSLFPMTAPLSMVMRMTLTNVPTWQILLGMALLFLSVLGMIWLAARLFRFQTLLSGKTPRFRDIPKLVRG